jgi:C_GCAxxG_C_C family probable redox protein
MSQISRAQLAAAEFKKGFSCSQAVFSAFGDVLGLDRQKALKIAQPFGGGIAQMGLTCGAATGAFLAIGLKYGRTQPEDEDAKRKTYGLVHDFIREFKARHGSIVCRELIGVDLGTPEGHQQAVERGVFENLCSKYVRDAVEILEKIL